MSTVTNFNPADAKGTQIIVAHKDFKIKFV